MLSCVEHEKSFKTSGPGLFRVYTIAFGGLWQSVTSQKIYLVGF